jgi:asparagine synthase (glutamine-hydrolysing)
MPEVPVGRKKQGFNIPKGIWFRGELKDFILDHLSTQQIKRMGFFKPEKVSQLINEHIAEVKDNSHQIWGLLYPSLWWQQFISNPAKLQSHNNIINGANRPNHDLLNTF